MQSMKMLAGVLILLALGMGAIVWLQRGLVPEQPGSALTVYCAAGLREPVAPLAEAYRRELGTQVHLQYGGSANLLSVIRVAQRGDLYIMADDGTLADARRLDLVRESIIAAAFAARTMRATFDHLSSRPEDVAMTLGCSRARAVWLVTLPSARKGMFAAMGVAWARSLGEFGPILVFAGATRMKTEVLPTTVWLELSVGNLEVSVAVSLLMVTVAMLVLTAIRIGGERI